MNALNTVLDGISHLKGEGRGREGGGERRGAGEEGNKEENEDGERKKKEKWEGIKQEEEGKE